MFLQALTPLAQEFAKQPLAFLGGFMSGTFRLDPAEDPLRSWLEKQGTTIYPASADTNGRSSGPQSITID
ncbi:MAG: hypothetical protein SW833_20690 [Cyanobacteriota bacterium]|nr:hypothetical protein [Cyanobacteriota bacterium]